MKFRMINFGYKMENGIIKVASDEAIVVAEIFSRYGQGEILKSIADDLTRRRIVYNKDNQTWNKSMISRIIENRRYIGDEGYPGIIAEEDYVRANNLKCQKAIKKATYSPEIEYLKSHLRCTQCGHKMYRHATWSTREKWFCKNGCQNDIYIGDQELFVAICNTLVEAKFTRNYILKNNCSPTFSPSLDVIRQTNDINRLLEQPDVQFNTMKKMIFRCVEMKFACCSYDEGIAHSEYINNSLEEWESTHKINVSLLKNIVKDMELEKEGTISITLINNARICGRR